VCLTINTYVEVEACAWALNIVYTVLAIEVYVNLDFEDHLVVAVIGAFNTLTLDVAFGLGLNVELDIELSVAMSLFGVTNVWYEVGTGGYRFRALCVAVAFVAAFLLGSLLSLALVALSASHFIILIAKKIILFNYYLFLIHSFVSWEENRILMWKGRKAEGCGNRTKEKIGIY
jgi:hypothetical protein